MTIFESTALFQKSKLFIARGLENDHPEKHEEFRIWAALSLELLAKSTLASKHPSLISEADDDSLLSACGVLENPAKRPRTVTAGTVFRRLQLILKSFTIDEREYCQDLSERRNSELHSGELPFASTKRTDWIGKYWRVCNVLLMAQNKSLEDWIGENQKDQALTEIAKLEVEAEVKALLEKHARYFLKSYSSEIAKQTAFAASATYDLFAETVADEVDKTIRYKCPACGCWALLGGKFWEEDEDWDGEGVTITITYATEILKCKICNLKIEGRFQLDAAHIPEDFETEKEADFDDYGND